MKFEELPDGSAESLYDLLKNALKDVGLNFNHITGQEYDRVRTMSGQLTELPARVKQNCSEKALYVHCCAHNFNLVLMDATCSLCSAEVFFLVHLNHCTVFFNFEPSEV